MSSDREHILGLIDQLVDAYNRGDAAGLIAAFADDYVDMSEGEPTVRGEQAMRHTEARLLETFTKFNGRLSVDVEELEVLGDWAYDYGRLRIELHPKRGGEPTVVERRFLEIWRRGPNGTWKAARGMDNNVPGLPAS
jgi:ketosteroid isomerase-like protein